MSILTRDEILKLISAGQIRIEPFLEKQVGPASIDLHLGNSFRVFKEIHPCAGNAAAIIFVIGADVYGRFISCFRLHDKPLSKNDGRTVAPGRLWLLLIVFVSFKQFLNSSACRQCIVAEKLVC